MKHFRKSGGFTLVELVVSIAVASLVTVAATTVLMLALRVNRQTSDTASQQNTVRALLSTMEKAATDGNITKVVSNLGSWQMLDDEDEETLPVFEYVAFDQKILANGIAILENVYASNVIFDDANKLLSISIETKEGTFETTVFVRTGPITETHETVEPEDSGITSVDKFLDILISQLNSNGKINYENLTEVLNKYDPTDVPNASEVYYSEWYIGGYTTAPGWNAGTPWCACYVSWALVEAGKDYVREVNNKEVHWYSHVDEFVNHFKVDVAGSSWKLSGEKPPAGSLVFFNFDTDEEADHIGVVLRAESDYIITIEGNSAGRVAMRSYPIGDPRILGYGVLSWPNN